MTTTKNFKKMLKEIAANELNETPEKLIDHLASLKDWILMQPHLNVRNDDKFLLSFLRNSKYRLDIAKDKIDLYHSVRTKFPEYYQDRCPISSNIKELLKLGSFLLMPQPNIDGCRIVISSLGDICKNDQFTLLDCLKKDIIIHDRISIYDDHSVIAGQQLIINFNGTNLSLAAQIPPILKILATGMENVYPIRFKRIHLVHLNEAPQIFRVLVKTICGLFKTKIAKRIVIHDDLESLYKEISKKNLPAELGGIAGTSESIMKENWLDLILNSEDWFADDLKYKSDESKRICALKSNEIYGVEGSFRKLELD